MKRMYVTLIIMLLLISWAGVLLGQKIMPADNDTTSMERALKLREEMHRRMLDKVINGIGSDDDLFEGMDSLLDTKSSSYEMEWIENKEGRTLVVTPKSKEQKLDINVKDGFISIEGKSEKKSDSGMVSSSFANSFSVPADCDASKVKMDQKDGKILISFPYEAARPVAPPAPKSNPGKDLKPIPPLGEEVTI